MVAVARALQLIRAEEERAAALETRRRVLGTIGDLHKGKRADSVEADDAPLLGTAEEIVDRIRRLQAGGVETILLVDPNATVDNLRAFAAEVMPAFGAQRAVAAE
jgi:alkanesulfonate monooxygenase SsuD/methylene tetrahydromethanopterin reductase-like flavin-dependent oxidoreductase (luciferase family)